MSDTITFNSDGTATCLWTEAIDLTELGTLTIERATCIEFNHHSQLWEVHTATKQGHFVVAGEKLYEHPSRNECLRWEKENVLA